VSAFFFTSQNCRPIHYFQRRISAPVSAECPLSSGTVHAPPQEHLFSALHEKSARFVTIAPHRSHFLYGMDPIFIHTALILRKFILLRLKAQNVHLMQKQKQD